MNSEKEKKAQALKSKSWHVQQEKILKDWGESSSCYRYLHFKAYQKHKATSMAFTLPIIIISTFTGTANFAQETFPDAWQEYVPLGIGGLNLLAAIMTTVLQFLKANELMEGHRVASISYGKLSRTIKLELALPIYERSLGGMDMIDRCRTEYDRLIEQSPPIPRDVLKKFDKKFPADRENFTRPEISDIEEIELFDSIKEQKTVVNVASAFKKKISDANIFAKKLMGLNPTDEKINEMNVFKSKGLSTTSTFADEAKNRVNQELLALRNKGIVSAGPPADEETEPEIESEPESEPETTLEEINVQR
jgi:hypothetical protein